MKPVYALWCLFLLLASSITSSQNADLRFVAYPQSKLDKSFFRLGDNVITISTLSHQERSFALVSLHHNETTAIEAAQEFINEEGGVLVWLENDEKHNIEFEFLNKEYSIDPNKIFTQKGRAKNIKTGPYKNTLSVQVQHFADYLYNIIPFDKHVVGIHNYEAGERSIKSFKKRKLARKVKSIFVNPARDVNNYFVTTDLEVFEALKQKKYNVVLQNQTIVRDDGSLGLVVTKSRRIYVDVIAEMGQTEEQKEMIAALAEILDPVSKSL